jgi:adenylylsulfate kinase
MEIYIQASFETCAARDPKGLYKKVAAGQVAQFTGKDSAFEPPAENDAAMTVDTEKNDIDASVKQILDVVEPVVRFG